MPWNRRRLVSVSVAGALVIGVVAALVWGRTRGVVRSPGVTRGGAGAARRPAKAVRPKPTRAAVTLRGAVTERPVLARPAAAPAPGAPVMPEAVVIGNDPAAVPQAGLNRATVVWEIMAEGLITRYMAIFVHAGSAKIGPVRSTRIYFDQLDRAYQIPFAHAGGNVDALDAIGTWHLESLDEIYGAGAFFWRGVHRVPPDNLYTSTALLNQGVRAAGYPYRSLILPPTGTAPAGGRATGEVRIDYANDPGVYVYEPGWVWSDGSWERLLNGSVAHVQDGATIRAGTVLMLVAQQAPDPDPYTPGALKVLWQDGGPAWVLRDGRRWSGTWQMGPQGIPVVYRDGQPLPAGNAPYWYEEVPAGTPIRFSGAGG